MGLAVAATVTTSASGQESPAAWRSQLELGFNGSSGNSSFSVLRTGASLTHLETERYELELSGLFRYGKNEERVIANDLRGTLKFDWVPDADLSPFTFVTASRDRIRKLDAKVFGGVGVKWTFFRSGAETKASLSLAGVLDHEDFDLAAGSTETEKVTTTRWSGRFKFDHSFGSGASLQHVTFWQPELGSFGDYLVEMTNSLSTRLVSNLSVVVRHEYLHDEIPPPGWGPNDQKLSVVLRVSL